MPLELFLFPFRYRYRDARTGRWIKARYKARPEEIAGRHAEREITGQAEIRSDIGGASNPYRIPHAELRRLQEAVPEINPHLANAPAVDALLAASGSVFLVGRGDSMRSPAKRKVSYAP